MEIHFHVNAYDMSLFSIISKRCVGTTPRSLTWKNSTTVSEERRRFLFSLKQTTHEWHNRREIKNAINEPNNGTSLLTVRRHGYGMINSNEKVLQR